MKKKLPPFQNDEEAEKFVDTADLSEYDLSQFKKVHFKFKPNATTRQAFAATDRGEGLTRCADADDMFKKLGI